MATLPLEAYEPDNISSPYGWRTIYGQREMHYGIDYPCPVGTPVLAYAAGTVYVSKMQNGGGGLGEYVTVRHGLTYTMYAHLSKRVVTAGQKVAEGTLLGYSGNTGRSTGPHLHFGICTGYVASSVNKSKWRDPLPELKKIIAEGEKSSMRNLRQGMKGNDVKYAQYLLRGYFEKIGDNVSNFVIDGSFGPITKTYVGRFQVIHGILDKKGRPDYIIGPKTRAALGLEDFHVTVFEKGAPIWFAGTPYDVTPKEVHSLKKWAELERAVRVWNLAFFNMSEPKKNWTTVNLRGKGKDIGYGGLSEMVSIDWANKVGGEKVAIRNGKRVGGSIAGKTGRNAVGLLADERFFITQSVMLATEYAMVSFMLAHYNVKLMIFEDGGGSTGLYIAPLNLLLAPKQEGVDGRRVASVLCEGEVV